MVDELQRSFAETLVNPELLGDYRMQEQPISDIPILTTEDGTIVCVKKREEVSAIGIVGASGNGKSLLLQGIQEGIFWTWGEDVALMNDPSGETLSWSEPSNVERFVKENTELGLRPTPLPIIYVYPNTTTLDLDETKLINKNYLKVSLPLREVLNNLPFYFNAICPEFQLGQSTMYAQNMIEDFEGCELPEDFYKVINEKFDDAKVKGFRGMKVKILNAFRAIFNEEILRVTASDAPCYLKLGSFMSNPMSTIMYANVIPSLVCSDLRSKKYQSAIIAYYIRSIFENQSSDEFKNRNIYLVIDELTTICSTEDKVNNPAKSEIINIVARGRINKIGVIYATQHYNKIPNEIKSAKLNYLITFKTTREIAKQIAADFVLPSERVTQITKLDKYEAVAMTTDKFVCYKGDKKWESSESFKGRIIFPCSNHKWV